VITLLRASDRIAVPWKNGGGITREVAIWPPGSGFENFDWRVSIAEVREAGPFSRFENIDRTLMILKGRLALTIAGGQMELDPASPACAFAGEADCSGVPVGGPVTDLNVMTRRGRSEAHCALVANQTHTIVAKITLLVARDETMVRQSGKAFLLRPLDALLTDENCELTISGKAFVIGIS
jgi:environmental stress-induced protein Ves